jgi:Iron/zinc purple acid phosphatase-like protein C
MEKLFYDNHVAMAFAGHVHGYERTNPMFDFASIEGGVTYVTIGDAGNREGHAGPWLLPTPEWSVHRYAHTMHMDILIQYIQCIWIY